MWDSLDDSSRSSNLGCNFDTWHISGLYVPFMRQILLYPFIFFCLSNSKVQGDWSLSQQAQDERQYASWTGCQSITGLCCMRFLIQMILIIAGTFRGRYVSLHSVYLQMPEKLLTKLSILSVSSSYILQSTCEWTWSSCTYSHAVSLIDVSVLTMLSLFCAWMLPFFACWDSEHIFQMW